VTHLNPNPSRKALPLCARIAMLVPQAQVFFQGNVLFSHYQPLPVCGLIPPLHSEMAVSGYCSSLTSTPLAPRRPNPQFAILPGLPRPFTTLLAGLPCVSTLLKGLQPCAPPFFFFSISTTTFFLFPLTFRFFVCPIPAVPALSVRFRPKISDRLRRSSCLDFAPRCHWCSFPPDGFYVFCALVTTVLRKANRTDAAFRRSWSPIFFLSSCVSPPQSIVRVFHRPTFSVSLMLIDTQKSRTLSAWDSSDPFVGSLL